MAKTKQRSNRQADVRIREKDDEYFKKQDDSYVLPPELNMSIKDGFRFGIGFILALLIFYAVVIVGIMILVRFGNLINF
ncbi:hypothetical protein EXS54_02635 [Patescibacteria group bacterium]|nr:hypothetical protein [Patescibacteria group bacterium]